MTASPTVDAHLDPWCVVPLASGEAILFGYALRHTMTAGLAWLSSSEVLEFDADMGRATTRSGRRYRLGRRVEPNDIGAEGEEARLAFQLLIGVEYEELDELIEVDKRWLQARKAARHLGVEPPIRTDCATRLFFAKYQQAYFAVRQRGERPTSGGRG